MSFAEVKKNFGFGCMRLPMQGEEVDLAQFSHCLLYTSDAADEL